MAIGWKSDVLPSCMLTKRFVCRLFVFVNFEAALRNCTLLSVASFLLCPAQDAPTFSTDVKVVTVLANVFGKHGSIISNLEQNDFTLLENGRPQTIRYLSRETDLPLTIGLMVDTSMSQERVIGEERGASLRFFDQVLRESKDKVFLMQFDMSVQTPQALTSSRRDLNEKLPLIDTPTRRELSMQSGGGTVMYDAIVQASNQITAKQTGRKALILLTDGVDHGSTATLQEAVDAAQRADTLIYSILFADGRFYGENGRGPLERLSRDTGGGFFEVTKKQSIEQIFSAIENQLRAQYNVGYVSDTPVRISEFRKIALSTKSKDQTVQARARYWAKR